MALASGNAYISGKAAMEPYGVDAAFCARKPAITGCLGCLGGFGAICAFGGGRYPLWHMGELLVLLEEVEDGLGVSQRGSWLVVVYPYWWVCLCCCQSL